MPTRRSRERGFGPAQFADILQYAAPHILSALAKLSLEFGRLIVLLDKSAQSAPASGHSYFTLRRYVSFTNAAIFLQKLLAAQFLTQADSL